MGIFDSLTGNAGHQAADNSRLTLASLIPNLSTAAGSAYNSAGDTLRTGYGDARTDLGTGYGTATGAIGGGAGQALGYLDQGQQGAIGQLAQARGDLTANGGAFQPLSNLAGQYGKGANLYADSLGINGAQGNQNAVSAFQAGPGYEFARNQGIDAITRAANASGGLGGNSLKDTITYGQGLANQEFGNWQNKLAPYNQLQLGATQGAATGNQANNQSLAGLGVTGANLLNSGGQNRAQVATGQGNALSDLARSYYGGLAGNDVAGAGALAGNTLGANSNNQNLFLGAIPGWTDTFKQDAKASNDASTNSLNLGMNLAKLAASAATGMPTGGGGGGNSFMPSSSFMNNSWGW